MTIITEVVELEKQGEIAMLSINNPPVNALSFAVRKGLADGIKIASKDEEIKAVVIICQGRTFCAGADIKEFGQPPKQPVLGKVLEIMDACPKPIIVAIHGTALGGGLEMAMTCHYRIAVHSALFGLPEVKLGLLPGAGGTQRLPRIVGIEKALKMITTGNPIGSQDALVTGLIDVMIEDDLQIRALAFAKKVVVEKRPLPRICEQNEKVESVRKTLGIFDKFRKTMTRKNRGFKAPEACIKALEASVKLPFDEGLKVERQLFEELRSGSQSEAQRYCFFA
jgi:3-hydroxyacyl-CoA dehydrogenase